MLLILVFCLLGYAMADCGDGPESCPSFQTSPYFLRNVCLQQPYYISAYPNTVDFTNIDSRCFTIQSTPDAFIAYATTVYRDGSYNIEVLVSKQQSPGIIQVSSSSGLSLTFSLGYTSCGLHVSYSCSYCGDCQQYPYATSVRYGNISLSALSDVQGVLSSKGVEQELIALPMNYGPLCYHPSFGPYPVNVLQYPNMDFSSFCY